MQSLERKRVEEAITESLKDLKKTIDTTEEEVETKMENAKSSITEYATCWKYTPRMKDHKDQPPSKDNRGRRVKVAVKGKVPNAREGLKITPKIPPKERATMVKDLVKFTKEALARDRVDEESLSNHRVVKALNNQFDSRNRLSILNDAPDVSKHHRNLKINAGYHEFSAEERRKAMQHLGCTRSEKEKDYVKRLKGYVKECDRELHSICELFRAYLTLEDYEVNYNFQL